MAAWRIISNIIPTSDNLHKWHVPLDPACILCWAESKTVWHLMIECLFARCTWLASSIGLRPGQQYRRSLKEWALALVNEVRSLDFECILIILWAIWNARNLKLWGEATSPSPSAVVRRAIDWWQEYLRINFRPPLPRRHAPIQKRSCPPPKRLKLNVDGAWCKETNLGGVGLIFWDSNGTFVAATSRIFGDIFSPIHIEALVIRKGLLMAIERGLQSISLESDPPQIISALKESSLNVSTIGPIIEDAKSLSLLVTEATASHVHHQANSSIGLLVLPCTEVVVLGLMKPPH